MGEETNFQSPRKTSLGHLRAVKQLITVALDLKRQRLNPEAFQSIQLDISRIFYVSKCAAARITATMLLVLESLCFEETGRSPRTRLCYSDL